MTLTKEQQQFVDKYREACRKEGEQLGEKKFCADHDVPRTVWRGKLWPSWRAFQQDAGYEPNKPTGRIPDDHLFAKAAALVRQYKRFPTKAEWTFERNQDSDLPHLNPVRERFKGWAGVQRAFLDWCRRDPEFADVVAVLQPTTNSEPAAQLAPDSDGGNVAFVYVVHDPDKKRLSHKIGSCTDIPQRMRQLKTSSPNLELVASHCVEHAEAVEKYWHTRLNERDHSGEWFELTKTDVRTFKNWTGIVTLKSKR